MERVGGRRSLLIVVAGLIATSAAIVGVIIASERAGEGTAENEIASFDKFALYWVGMEFEGAPFDQAILPDSAYAAAFMTYGACGEAFQFGCEPTFFLKITDGCLPRVDETERVRGRTVYRGADRLAVQAGGVVVEIFGESEMRTEIANEMVLANARALSYVRAVPAGADLPGSVCELERFNPRPTVTTSIGDFVEPTPSVEERAQLERAERVFDLLGDFRNFDSYEEVEAYLGWKVVRVTDPRYTRTLVCCAAGSTSVLRGQRPAFSQRYWVAGTDSNLLLLQQPESNRWFEPPDEATEVTIGRWTGMLWDGGFEFFSSTTLSGERIRVSLAHASGEITEEHIRRFVEMLEFDD